MTWIASFGRSGPEGEGRRGLGQRGKGGEVWARGGREERSGPEGEGRRGLGQRGKGGEVWVRGGREERSGPEGEGRRGLGQRGRDEYFLGGGEGGKRSGSPGGREEMEIPYRGYFLGANLHRENFLLQSKTASVFTLKTFPLYSTVVGSI